MKEFPFQEFLQLNRLRKSAARVVHDSESEREDDSCS